jgi:hypothetical protein
MPRPKILKPGQVVYDLLTFHYVVFKAPSADHPDKAFVYDPYEAKGEAKIVHPKLTTIRPLNRKELGLP